MECSRWQPETPLVKIRLVLQKLIGSFSSAPLGGESELQVQSDVFGCLQQHVFNVLITYPADASWVTESTAHIPAHKQIKPTQTAMEWRNRVSLDSPVSLLLLINHFCARTLQTSKWTQLYTLLLLLMEHYFLQHITPEIQKGIMQKRDSNIPGSLQKKINKEIQEKKKKTTNSN